MLTLVPHIALTIPTDLPVAQRLSPFPLSGFLYQKFMNQHSTLRTDRP